MPFRNKSRPSAGRSKHHIPRFHRNATAPQPSSFTAPEIPRPRVHRSIQAEADQVEQPSLLSKLSVLPDLNINLGNVIPFNPRGSFPIFVSGSDLRNATDSGLSKLSNSLLARVKHRIYVEASPYSKADSLFYTPFSAVSGEICPPLPTEFVSVFPTPDTEHLVTAADDFEVTFAGMHVPPRDGPLALTNELLLYSVSPRPPEPEESSSEDNDISDEIDSKASLSADQRYTSTAFRDEVRRELKREQRRQREEMEKELGPPKTFAHLNPNDDPTIHYDPVEDGHDVGTTPNTYRAVPGFRSLLMSHRGSLGKRISAVPIRFTVIEVDNVTSAQRMGVEKVGSLINRTAKAVPFGSLISPAVDGLTQMGKVGLESYAKPDHVISKDLFFRLLPQQPAKTGPSHSGILGCNSSANVEKYADNYLRVRIFFKIYSASRRTAYT